jgi:electron transfer flavoprotein alpha subunit
VILVIAAQRDGKLNRATWETIAAAQQVAGTAQQVAGTAQQVAGTAQQLAGGMPITVAVLGAATGGVSQEVASASVAEVLVGEHAALDPYTPDAYAAACRAVIESTSPTYVLLPHTYQTRDFAPLLAASIRKPLITDVTGINGIGSDAIFVRPMFQGKLAAQVKPQGGTPALVTMQIGAFRADAAQKGGSPAVKKIEIQIDPAGVRQKPEAPFREAKQAVDLGQAERIVAVGRGIKSQDNIPLVEKLAVAMGAEVAASRPICDNGWLPMERQIGSSGQTVAPKLYVALGISGAIQHLVGMKGSRTIVAINKDAEAPIFEVADYGIVGDLFEITPAIIAELEKS